MQQKILTYFYNLTGDEYVHLMEKDITEQTRDGWHAISVSQSIFPTKKQDRFGQLLTNNELAITILFEKND